MKTWLLIALFASASLALAQVSIEAVDRPTKPDPFGPRQTEKATYLGVAVAPCSPVLREQLKLPRGVGLVVEVAEAGGPTEAAGLKQYDVLHKLNDQILVNAEQLSVLVRMHKPGDEVKLTVIRQGQSMTLTAKLTEKDMPVLGGMDEPERLLPPLALAQSSTGPMSKHELAALFVAASQRVDRPTKPDPGACRVEWGPQQTEKGTYLGVAVAPCSPVLREQLKLPRGVGLVVEVAEAGGPTEAAGLKQYDVLHKLNDQILVNAEQLSVLVRMHKPGDEVKLTVIRQGQSMTLTAKLTEKDLPVLGGMREPEFLLPPQQGRVREGMGRVGEFGGESISVSVSNGEASATLSDKQHVLSLTEKQGRKRLTATDSGTGVTIFNGEINTDEQRKTIPASILKKLEALEKNLQGAAPPPVPPPPAQD